MRLLVMLRSVPRFRALLKSGERKDGAGQSTESRWQEALNGTNRTRPSFSTLVPLCEGESLDLDVFAPRKVLGLI
jgi:hypothetical protein